MKTQHINGFQQMDQVHTKIDNRGHKRDNIQQRMDDRFKMTTKRQTRTTPIHSGFGEITGEQFTFDQFDRFTPYRKEKSDVDDFTYERDEPNRQIQNPVSFSSYGDGFATFGQNQKIVHNKSTIGNDINKFTLDFMVNYMKHSKKQFCISPFSIYEVFATLYDGSGGETKNQLESFFSYSANLQQSLKIVHDQIIKDGLKIKNIIAVADKYKCINNNTTTSTIKFNGGNDVAKINDLIKKETNGLINNILSPDMLMGCPLLLLNILYFKSEWKKKFNTKQTRIGIFNNKHEVMFMNLMDGKNQYYENQSCQLLEKDYIDNWTMGFILPKNNSFDIMNLPTFINNLKEETINHLMIPKFEIKTKCSIMNLLRHMGCDVVESKLNVSKMITMNNGQPHDDLYIGNIIHSAVIKVDEEGTEAAAVTAMVSYNCIEQDKNEINFIANVPFFYYIRNKTTGIISFIGEFF